MDDEGRRNSVVFGIPVTTDQSVHSHNTGMIGANNFKSEPVCKSDNNSQHLYDVSQYFPSVSGETHENTDKRRGRSRRNESPNQFLLHHGEGQQTQAHANELDTINWVMRCDIKPGMLEPDVKWDYCKRRTFQEIIPNLFLGPFCAARDAVLLSQCKITNIIITRSPEEAQFIVPKFPECFEYKILELRDSCTENILTSVHETVQYISKCLGNGRVVLVHGNAGMSRSAAIVCAYIMYAFKMEFVEAAVYALKRRHCIYLNPVFRSQLLEYEMMLYADEQSGDVTSEDTHRRGTRRTDSEL